MPLASFGDRRLVSSISSRGATSLWLRRGQRIRRFGANIDGKIEAGVADRRATREAHREFARRHIEGHALHGRAERKNYHPVSFAASGLHLVRSIIIIIRPTIGEDVKLFRMLAHTTTTHRLLGGTDVHFFVSLWPPE